MFKQHHANIDILLHAMETACSNSRPVTTSSRARQGCTHLPMQGSRQCRELACMPCDVNSQATHLFTKLIAFAFPSSLGRPSCVASTQTGHSLQQPVGSADSEWSALPINPCFGDPKEREAAVDIVGPFNLRGLDLHHAIHQVTIRVSHLALLALLAVLLHFHGR